MSVWISVFVLCFNPIKPAIFEKLECTASVGAVFKTLNECVKESAKKFYAKPTCIEKKLNETKTT